MFHVTLFYLNPGGIFRHLGEICQRSHFGSLGPYLKSKITDQFFTRLNLFCKVRAYYGFQNKVCPGLNLKSASIFVINTYSLLGSCLNEAHADFDFESLGF